ncbi:MAG: D-alanyl-D-alanine carboxypeptidase/D-alanyl-D-alanine-endopeptidase [Bacteroidetes bacterium]|nr:D-alanyl-D-alanine carboxypeptidase/D-alanyl-D-alanine-endopeptidase [Bacteroidota bacterium]
MRISGFLIALGLLLLFSSWNKPKSNIAFDNEVKKFAADPGIKHSSWGLSIFSIESEKEIYSYNSNLSLTPASTLKALTTSTALILLGPDYKYKTTLSYTGKIDNSGNLNGDLIFKGSGDPSFGAGRMNDSLKTELVIDHFYNAINLAGIKRINGNIIVDASVFDSIMVSPKWLWEDLGNYFGAGTSGLSFNENEYSVFFRASNTIGGETTVVRVNPFVPGLILHNSVLTAAAGTGDNVYIYGIPYSNERFSTGTIPLGANEFEVRGSIPDPPYFFAATFNNFLNSKGIQTTGSINVIYNSQKSNINQSELNFIAEWVSPELTEIAYRTNLVSVNSYAESLIKTISASHGNTGTTQDGIKIMLDLWREKGVNTNGVKIYDGSGLSPSNCLTLQFLANCLAITANNEIFTHFQKGLPVAGKSGSLRNGFTGTASENVLTAKSGFLSNVRAFAGYTTTKNGKQIAFAFIVNNYDGTQAELRTKMNRLMDQITSLVLD